MLGRPYTGIHQQRLVMPGLDPGIRSHKSIYLNEIDGRGKPGHAGSGGCRQVRLLLDGNMVTFAFDKHVVRISATVDRPFASSAGGTNSRAGWRNTTGVRPACRPLGAGFRG